MHDWIPFNNLCNEYSRIGQPQKAVVAGQTALRLNPRHSFPYAALSLAYQRSSRFPEAKAIGERAIAEKLDGSTVHRVLYQIAFAEHDSAAMDREAAWFKGKPDEAQINNSQARGLMILGQVRKAREAFQRSAETARSRGLQGYAAGNLGDAAKFEGVLGNPAEAHANLAASQRLNLGSFEDDSDWALLLALAGDTRRAEAAVKNLSAKNPLDTLVINTNVSTARAILDLTRNNPAAAVDALRPAIPFDLSTPNDGLTLYYRGVAYLKLGAGKEAAAEFQKVLDNPGVTA